MPEVKWQARRISDGVLVDVTGDTSGTPQSAPTANALVRTSLLGPYHIGFDTPGVMANPFSGIPLLPVTLNEGQIITQVLIASIASWTATGNPAIDFHLGGYPESLGISEWNEFYLLPLRTAAGAQVTRETTSREAPWTFPTDLRGTRPTADGLGIKLASPFWAVDGTRIGAYVSDDVGGLITVSAGAVRFWLLIAEPA